MSTLTVTNTFTGGTNAVPGDVNTNFDQIEAYVNTECITKDAALAFTGVPSGPATDATTANQFTRKGYVDPYIPKNIQAEGVVVTSTTGPNTLATLDIPDPGYDIQVWGNAFSIGIASVVTDTWELMIYSEGVQFTGLRIPTLGHTSMGVSMRMNTYATGTYGPNLTISSVITRVVGTGTISTFLDPRYNFLDIWYRKKYT